MAPRKKGSSAPAQTDHGGSIEDVFFKITNALEDLDYTKVLKLVDGVLKKFKSDKDALKVKLFALLMIGHFPEALDLIQSSKALQEQCKFEHAYCLYKCADLAGALDLLADSNDEASLQLIAMVHMRAGNTMEAAGVYRRLVPHVAAEKQSANELATNTIAALSLSGGRAQIPGALQQLRVKDRDSLEVALNMACAAVLDGELDRAMKLLQLAETRGNETLIEENATQAEMEQELGPVRAQSAYISLLRGDVLGASSAFSTLVTQPVGKALHAVCTNNVVCVRAMQSESFSKDARRKLAPFIDAQTASVTTALAQRLPQAAQVSLQHNHALAGVLAAVGASGRMAPLGTAISQTCSAAQAILQDLPDLEDALLLHAAACGLLQSADQGIKAVNEWLQGHPSANVTRSALMGAHIACSAQPPKLDAALSFLTHERLAEDIKHAPAVLATRAYLRDRLARPEANDESGQELQAAIDWWTSQVVSSARGEALSACYEQQSAFLIRVGDMQGALKSLNALKDVTSLWGSAARRARLAWMLAGVDLAAVASYANSGVTGQLHQTVSVKEAEELELSTILSKGTSVLLGPYVRGSGAEGGRPQRKRKRKPRYPKGFDPENPGPPPDPERWLPWHERAANKKRRKRKGNAPISKGAQGMGAVDESLDKSHITVEDLDARVKAPVGPRIPPRNTKGKRKGKR
eukprot:jgi/Ulvmu1/5434/UM022_0229.1